MQDWLKKRLKQYLITVVVLSVVFALLNTFHVTGCTGSKLLCFIGLFGMFLLGWGIVIGIIFGIIILIQWKRESKTG